jgi:hypothetical protein
MSNHVSRFYSAVTVLAGHGRIKQRLIDAFEQNLAGIEDAELPLGVRQSFAELRQMMSQVDPLNGEGSTCASVRKMSVEEADECAHKMIDLFGDMIRFGDDAQVALPLHLEDQPQVPPFLVKTN